MPSSQETTHKFTMREQVPKMWPPEHESNEKLSKSGSEKAHNVTFEQRLNGVEPPKSTPATNGAHDEADLAPIAIIGVSCRLPGSVNNLQQFTDFCAQGEEAWSEFPKERFNIDSWYHSDHERARSINVRSGHFLDENQLKGFDNEFFSISPKEARTLDPRARLHLETAYEAFENAGIPLSTLVGSSTGVFVGAFLADYASIMGKDPALNNSNKATGVGIALLANRLSYWFDLKGPSMTLDTACSASAFALHLACESLRSGETKMSLVSGANLILDPENVEMLTRMKFLSVDGKSYMFDQRAEGYAKGEGIATLILKPLTDALRDNDPVHAVIMNTASNQDGRTPGITLPSKKSQQELIENVYRQIGLDPSETALFEAHGTGTRAGDRIEADALAQGLRTSERSLANPLNVVSIKTKMGHCEGASGVCGILQAVAALKSRAILPNCNFEAPSDQIKFDEWRIRVPTKLEPWTSSLPRRVSINSFGYGGSNVHTILQEADHTDRKAVRAFANGIANGTVNGHSNRQVEPSINARKVLFLSANAKASLQTLMGQIAVYLETHDDPMDLSSLVYTLGQRRTPLKYRAGFVGDSAKSLCVQLQSKLPGRLPRVVQAPKIGFVFTGQGAQWSKMGCDLMDKFPIYSSVLEELERQLRNFGAEWSLCDELRASGEQSKIDDAYLSQPLCTAIQLALTEMLRSWGIIPVAVVGHSSGEIAAAYAAGKLSMSEAIAAAYFRGMLSDQLSKSKRAEQGAMLAVGLAASEVKPYLKGLQCGKITIACFNSPQSITLSGAVGAIDEVKGRLDADSCFNRKLRVNVAYHSDHMRQISEEYRNKMAPHSATSISDGNVKFYSSVKPGVAVDTNTEYWVQNLLSPVRFNDALAEMMSETDGLKPDLLLEIGPHPALAGPMKQILKGLKIESSVHFVGTLQRGKNDIESLLSTACDLLSEGVDLHLAKVNFPVGEERLPVLTDLPTYPWKHDTVYWHEGRLGLNYLHREFPVHDLLGCLNIDSSVNDMKWVNHLRASTIPWVRDHKILDEVLFPAAGYMCMAIEASRQKALLRNLDIKGIRLRDVSFTNPLVLKDQEEDGIEIAFILEPMRYSAVRTSESWDSFRVISYTERRKAVEHCSGKVSLSHNIDIQPASSDQEVLKPWRHDKIEELGESWKFFTEVVRSATDQLGPLFRLQEKVYRSGNRVVSTMRIPDTASVMPTKEESTSFIRVPVLDDFVQTPIYGIDDLEALLGKAADIYVVPTFVREVSISLNVPNTTGSRMWSLSQTRALSSRSHMGDVLVTAEDGSGELKPVAELRDLQLNLVETENNVQQTDPSESMLCWNLQWNFDVDFITENFAISNWQMKVLNSSDSHLASELQHGTWIFLKRTWEFARTQDHCVLPEHLKKYLGWVDHQYQAGMKGKLGFQTPEWNLATEDENDKLVGQLEGVGDLGEMMVRVGRRMPDILSQKIEALTVLLEDGLLMRFYEGNPAYDRAYKTAERYADVLAHKYPGLKVLEVGAGTGSATSFILPAIAGRGSWQRRVSSYVFTDISAGFFEKAREKFAEWSDVMTYKALNIEVDPTEQGFSEQYDLVVAANALHATSDMDATLQYARKLLRPGGKLMLIEVTNMTHVMGSFIFGLLPGWWLSADGRADGPLMTNQQWKQKLQHNGFSHIDFCLKDVADDLVQHCSTIVATRTDDNPQIEPSDPQILYINESERHFANAVSMKLHRSGHLAPPITTLANAPVVDRPYILIDSSDTPLLGHMNGEEFDQLRSIFDNCSGMIWVTSNGQFKSERPLMGSVTGFLRSLRMETQQLPYISLDVGRVSQDLDIKNVIEIYDLYFEKSQNAQRGPEFEYVSRSGDLMIPRLVSDQSANQKVRPISTEKSALKMQPLWQQGKPFKMEFGQIGLLDSIRFVPNQLIMSTPLPEDQIEICVKSVGMNFKDVLIAIGSLNVQSSPGFECSGTVTKVGSQCTQFKVGQRVCAMPENSFATHVRLPPEYAVEIPDAMDFPTAAAVPSAFTTAYGCIYDSGRLQSTETILIHSAAGGLGQACVQLAKIVGANIIVSCGDQSKIEFLQQHYSIQRDHILDSRSVNYRSQVMRLTRGKGVDVLINSLAGEGLLEGWRCMSPMGRFVDVSKRDGAEDSMLPMLPFLNGASYISFQADVLAAVAKTKVQELLRKGASYVFDGKACCSKPITAYKISEAEHAFRAMQSGKIIGKIVMNLDDDCQVPVAETPKPALSLSKHASYMIVGGLTGIGAAFARWMSQDLGATHLILLSRSGINAKGAKDLISTLVQSKTTVKVIACDVANAQDLEKQLEECSKVMPPIRGVFQGAMVLQDSMFSVMSYEKFVTARRPKIEGSQNLHDYFADRSIDLDFFVFFSSLAGLGHASQSNYAAGNTFQDALAHHRVSKGLPALSINIGSVMDVGWTAEHYSEISEADKALTFKITTKDLMALVEHHVTNWLKRGEKDSVAVSPQVAIGLKQALPEPLFKQLEVVLASQAVPTDQASSSKGGDSLEARITAAGKDKSLLTIAVENGFREKLSRVLAMSPEDVHLDDTFNGHGVDSLVAVELRNWIRKELGETVTVPDILTGRRSIKSIAGHIAGNKAGK